MNVGLVFFCSQRDGFPDKEGQKRLDKAIALFRAGAINVIMVTGGKRQDAWLGEIYADYLKSAGIPDLHIWVENQSNSTASNLKRVNEDLLQREMHLRLIDSTWIITDIMQIARIRILIRYLYWPWPTFYISTGINWRYLPWEPPKLLINIADPQEKFLGWFKRRRERTVR